MEEEINQIKENETWELLHRPTDKNLIGTKWVFRKKMNDDGHVVRNKSRLHYKGYAQVQGVYFEENFSFVSGMKPFECWNFLV